MIHAAHSFWNHSIIYFYTAIFYSIEVQLNIVNYHCVCFNHHLQSYFLNKYILLLTIIVTFLCRTIVFLLFIATTLISMYFLNQNYIRKLEINILLFFSLVTRILQLKLQHSSNTTNFQLYFFIYFYINSSFFFKNFDYSFELSLGLVQKNYLRLIQCLHVASTGILVRRI